MFNKPYLFKETNPLCIMEGVKLEQARLEHFLREVLLTEKVHTESTEWSPYLQKANGNEKSNLMDQITRKFVYSMRTGDASPTIWSELFSVMAESRNKSRKMLEKLVGEEITKEDDDALLGSPRIAPCYIAATLLFVGKEAIRLQPDELRLAVDLKDKKGKLLPVDFREIAYYVFEDNFAGILEHYYKAIDFTKTEEPALFANNKIASYLMLETSGRLSMKSPIKYRFDHKKEYIPQIKAMIYHAPPMIANAYKHFVAPVVGLKVEDEREKTPKEIVREVIEANPNFGFNAYIRLLNKEHRYIPKKDARKFLKELLPKDRR